MKNEYYHIVSLSGGKDSTAMLLRMLELDMPIDKIIYFDCGDWEFPEMAEHIIKIEKYIHRKITRIKPEKSFHYWMFEHEVKSKKKLIGCGFPQQNSRWCTREKQRGLRKGRGFPEHHLRWCTSNKRDTIRKEQNKNKPFIDYLGYAVDELQRMKPINYRNKKERYPLIEWEWTEEDALQYCYSKGFDWDGLYEIFHRVSCWCCPFQRISELRNLRKHFPELWKRLLDMQAKTWNKFKSNYSVFNLEERFALEDKQLSL